jgi:hypothetical protein
MKRDRNQKDGGLSTAPADPLKPWRDWFVQNEREWSETLTRMMKDESVARVVGQEINSALHRQQMLTQGMATPMAMMNLPTREDVIGLAERIGRLEDGLARIEAMFVQMRNALPGTVAPAPVPARTRKPAAARKAR